MLQHEVRDETAPSGAIPVTIVGGSAGAGKTTFINHILAGRAADRVAVVMHEFGSTALDRQRVADIGGRTVELRDGCACCTHLAELVLALAGLRDGPNPPHHILIEAHDASDPRRIVDLVGLRGLRFEAIVALADVEAVRVLAGDPGTGVLVRRQLGAADMIVLNRTDLVTWSEKDAVHDWLSELAPGARIVEATHGRVPTELVLLHRTQCSSPQPGRRADPTRGEAEYARWVWVSDEMLDGPAFRWWAANLPVGVLGGGGELYLEEDPSHRYVFHLLGGRWALVRDLPWATEHPRNHVVLLGRRDGMDHGWLDMMIARCLGHQLHTASSRWMGTAP